MKESAAGPCVDSPVRHSYDAIAVVDWCPMLSPDVCTEYVGIYCRKDVLTSTRMFGFSAQKPAFHLFLPFVYNGLRRLS